MGIAISPNSRLLLWIPQALGITDLSRNKSARTDPKQFGNLKALPSRDSGSPSSRIATVLPTPCNSLY